MAALDRGAGVKFPPPLLYVFLGVGILASIWYPLGVLPPILARTLGGVLLAAGALIGPIWEYAPCIAPGDREAGQAQPTSGGFRTLPLPSKSALSRAGLHLRRRDALGQFALGTDPTHPGYSDHAALGNLPRERPPGACLRRAIRALHEERPPLALIGPIRRPADADVANLEAFGGFLPGRSFRLMVALRTTAPYKLTSTASESHPAITFESS